MNSSSFALLVTLAWPIVALVAVLAVVILLGRTLATERARVRSSGGSLGIRLRATTDELDGILDAAIALNAQYSRQDVDPAVHLAAALRVAPVDFVSSALEIGRSMRMGNVTIVDFAQLEIQEARRLADFCGGLACQASAWIFRPSNAVLIITPPRRS